MDLKTQTYSKYAILTRTTELRMHATAEVPSDRSSEAQTLTMVGGTLIKMFQSQTPVEVVGTKNMSTVQILDLVRQEPIYENLYECPQANLLKVSEALWPYVISIEEPERRLWLVKKEDHCKWIVYLKVNDLVRVSGGPFGKESTFYDCIIRYIGPVSEIHPVGYFFGLELLHLENGFSPQSENIPFSIEYMSSDPSLSIFTTADNLRQSTSEVHKKFSVQDFIGETFTKVRTAIVPSTCANGGSGGSNTNSLRRPKKLKKKYPSSQFYDTPSSPPVESLNTTVNRRVETGQDYEMDRESGKMKHSDELDNATPIISAESDDYKKSIENYERSLERQRGSTVTSAPVPVPTGILKHRHTSASASSGGGSGNKDASVAATTVHPLNLMSMDDREIIIIDPADIRESTKNESNVIVVDKNMQQEVDLAELLGGNWPTTAGDAAAILNNKQLIKSQQTTGSGSQDSIQAKGGRIKSPNPLTHFGGVKSTANVATEGFTGGDGTGDAIGSNKYANSRDSPVYDNLVDIDAPTEMDLIKYTPLQDIPDTALGVGSMVEVSIPEASENLYGVIRWIGMAQGRKQILVGVELEEDQDDRTLPTTNGTYNGMRFFRCHEGRALFVPSDRCSTDRRFIETDGKAASNIPTDSKMFGQVECPSVPGAVAPLKIKSLEELEENCGKFKGIQGHHNSCYLDATLFSMFTFTSVFDSLLFRPPEADDIASYTEVQKVLREEIVNPLRKNVFVRADRVMKLRQLLDKLSSVSGLTSEEKDPEEFLNSLLAQIMRVEPFLKLSSGQDAYFYQLFVEKDERLCFPTVQQLFEQSFHSSDIKLKEVPSCLIIQMPRFGKNFKMYPRILPSQLLDVTDIIEDSPRQCSVCGKLAEYECRDCYGVLQSGVGLESTAFCLKCRDTVHLHARRTNHNPKKLSVPQDFRIMAEHMNVPRLYMELFAVVCIETSHYVAFVKAGSGPDAPWCFFDSMADRKGEKNGYNIPEMITVPDLPLWLSEEGARAVNETSTNDKMLPEHAKRLFCDAYMCMYQSTDVMMYR
ncbi:ubiquitin carboxyl-terminal hydrolase CYLD isoform X1 [Anastrepha ludens]|uniref:ubiquitin carboxyl-terminal hydrolase CYLD isoform X1 n=1 Tax=Anastrepha ludens TaxID=28586 RepID=UPI0023AF312B|nr:ubiquitin carboxyl-terminal hydrolase CYLD isoform X1 [Anastrepha ludens]XP_053960107.1 ubiquitin carboxyl-terminal hydrolase CYLD isoform X1 [Anastrepha ludens]XP_053960108.1 ubiquitin carboxyl-terminal hydrolase CYLD isoform X1 [Anastrepha ludens]